MLAQLHISCRRLPFTKSHLKTGQLVQVGGKKVSHFFVLSCSVLPQQLIHWGNVLHLFFFGYIQPWDLFQERQQGDQARSGLIMKRRSGLISNDSHIELRKSHCCRNLHNSYFCRSLGFRWSPSTPFVMNGPPSVVGRVNDFCHFAIFTYFKGGWKKKQSASHFADVNKSSLVISTYLSSTPSSIKSPIFTCSTARYTRIRNTASFLLLWYPKFSKSFSGVSL